MHDLRASGDFLDEGGEPGTGLADIAGSDCAAIGRRKVREHVSN
jgi:hypothetical protein